MITGKSLKELAALHKRGDKPSVSVQEKVALIFSKFFVLELPKDEVTEEATNKYSATPGAAPVNWRETFLNKAEGTVAHVSRESAVHAGEVIEVIKLDAGSVVRWMLPEFYDFFVDQLLRPNFKVHEGTRSDGSPSAISIWEGNSLVGVMAPWDKDADDPPGDDPPPEEEDSAEE